MLKTIQLQLRSAIALASLYSRCRVYCGMDLGLTVIEESSMELVDLLKATIVCGLLAFLCYSYPVVGQVIVIAVLTVLWSVYAWRAYSRLRQRTR